MKDKGIVSTIFLKFLILILIVFGLSCKKEPEKQISPEMSPTLAAEIDIQQIENSTGIQFFILKAQTVGYMPRHRFYWVCVENEISRQKTEELAQAIINETISSHPQTYHSFLIHFFLKSELRETVESSKSFAQATYLPEGSRQNIRRIAVENYDNYKLNCTFFD